jgi:hypothetical protein
VDVNSRTAFWADVIKSEAKKQLPENVVNDLGSCDEDGKKADQALAVAVASLTKAAVYQPTAPSSHLSEQFFLFLYYFGVTIFTNNKYIIA